MASLTTLLLNLGCSSGRLTASQAQAVLDDTAALEHFQPIFIDAVSQDDGSSEAIVRTRFEEAVLNLKFRRYDKGWTWEFAETKDGGWVAPEVVVSHLLEERRVKRAAEWVAQHRGDYEATIRAMNGYSDHLPRRPGMMMRLGWLAGRDWYVKVSKTSGRSVEDQKQFLAENLGADRDAWGNEIVSTFSDSKRNAVFLSPGPDKESNTPDDVVCVAQGIREWDNDYDTVLWNFYKSWQVPEGLEEYVKPHVGPPGKGDITVTKVVSVRATVNRVAQ